jgi:tetratricopeptide (TPR) repeat protein
VRHASRLCAPFALAALLALFANDARAAGEIVQPAATATAVASAQPAASAALPELPKLPPLTTPEPDPAALQELDRLLDRLTTGDARARTDAHTALAEVTPGTVAAVRVRIAEIRGSLDRKEAQGLLEDARKAGRKGLREKDKAEGKTSKDASKSKATTKDAAGSKSSKDKPASKAEKDKEAEDDAGDWLDFVLASPKPKNDTWRDLVKLLAMERMLANVGTTTAVRELIQLYSYFGEMLRIDLQRQVAKLRDKAVPALIEARQHDAKIVQRFASKQLDVLGRAIPGEAVGVTDPQVLADVLRAYGRTRDVDAVRVVLSFCNSDRIQLRDAAREAIAAIGEPGIWQLRDAYLNQTGNKAPREFTWDRIARELFAMYDRARLAEVYKLMDEGSAHAQAGKYAEATEAFDKVLARSPVFERRKEMVAAYVERAKQLEPKAREESLEMLRKALRLDPKGERARKIEAEIAYLEGMLLIERGTPDKFPLTKAIELDPTNDRARQALASLEQERVAPKKSQLHRYAAAGGVGLLAVIAMILLARRKDTGAGAEPPRPPPASGGADSGPAPAAGASETSPAAAD